MADDVNTITTGTSKSGVGFAKFFSTEDATTALELVAAPGAGKRIIIQSLLFSVPQTTIVGVVFKSGATELLGPLEQNVYCSPAVIPIMPPGLAMGVNEALTVTVDEAAEIWGFVQGYISK